MLEADGNTPHTPKIQDKDHAGTHVVWSKLAG